MVGFGAALDVAASAGEFEQVGLDIGDVVFEFDEVAVGVTVFQVGQVVRVEQVGVVGAEAVERGAGGVVGFDDFGAVSGFGEEFLLGQE